MGQQAALRLLPDGGLVAVLVPSLALVAQTVSSWQELHPAEGPLHVLAICSDDTVIDAPAHLPDVQSPVTTDPAHVAQWLQTGHHSGIRLIVSTYASAHCLHQALQGTGAQLDLLVLDEAHHLTGRVELPIRRVTDPAFLPSTRRLYMTATPRTYAGAQSSGNLSMDDTAVFGPVLYSYPFSRGIAEGYLEDYRLYVVGMHAAEARALLGDPQHDYVEGAGAPSLLTLVAQVALVRAAQKYGTRRAVTFHHRVETAAEFARTLPTLSRRLAPDLPAPTTAHVHGKMDHSLRERILADLREPPADAWTVISNARCLGEGVDVPALDAVLFAHPKSSAVDIVQAVGRALRPHPDTPGPSTVIVPLVVPAEDGEIGDLDPGDYATLWHVIRALRAHDEPLGIALDYHRTSLSVSNPRLPAKITLELPADTAQSVLDQVELMLVRQTASPWWDGYAAAGQYRAARGHLNTPLRYITPDGFQLGQWLVKQRQFRRNGWLPDDRIEALDKLDIVWDPSEDRWAATYQLAREWHAEHGHLNIPNTLAGGVRNPLGQWIVRQRQYRRAGTLSDGRIRRLDALGMIWEHRDSAWLRSLDALAAYRQEHGDTFVPQRYARGGFRLGAWVSQMRAKYAAGKLSAQRIADLEQAGMVWRDDTSQSMRRKALASARSWHRAHGTLDVPYNTRHEGVRLGAWLAKQRTAHAAGELSADIAEPLAQLGMIWEPRPRSRPASVAEREQRAKAWDRGYQAAAGYFRTHGHLKVPRRHNADGLRLDAWLARQRTARRDGRLTESQIDALTRIGMNWGNLPQAHDTSQGW